MSHTPIRSSIKIIIYQWSIDHGSPVEKTKSTSQDTMLGLLNNNNNDGPQKNIHTAGELQRGCVECRSGMMEYSVRRLMASMTRKKLTEIIRQFWCTGCSWNAPQLVGVRFWVDEGPGGMKHYPQCSGHLGWISQQGDKPSARVIYSSSQNKGDSLCCILQAVAMSDSLQ